MSKLYDGALTVWLDIEICRVLDEILPPQGKYYEGKNSFEVKTKHPLYNQTRQKLIAIARDYSERENSDYYDSPVEVTGDVHHGVENE